MAHEPDVALLMTACGSFDIFLTRLLRMKFFSVIIHLPDYKGVSSTRNRFNSKKLVIKEKIQIFTIV